MLDLLPHLSWEQTADAVQLTVRAPPGVAFARARADVFTTDLLVKINAAPHLLVVDLYAAVDDEQTVVTVSPEHIKVRLAKREAADWPALQHTAASKQEQQLRRLASIDAAQERADQRREDAKRQKREAERFALQQQIDLETAERERVAAKRAAEKAAAEAEVYEALDQESAPQKRKPAEPLFTDADASLPAPRKNAPVKISFGPKKTPGPARESASKPAPVRKAEAAPNRPSDARDVSERNQVWLKDRGDSLFRTGDFRGALNAYSAALSVDDAMGDSYGNRAACHLQLAESAPSKASRANSLTNCVADCNAALKHLLPPEPENEIDRDPEARAALLQSPEYRHKQARLFARRGAAFWHLGKHQSALHDYAKAVAMMPDRQDLCDDLAALRAQAPDYAAVGVAAYEAKAFRHAGDMFAVASQLAPDNAEYVAGRAAALLVLGEDLETVVGEVSRILAGGNPAGDVADKLLARRAAAHTLLGRNDEAAQDYRALLERHPGDVRLEEDLAGVLGR